MGNDAARMLSFPTKNIKTFLANWTVEGKAAGPIRNSKMLAEGRPNRCYAFHDDLKNSKGTKDMVAKCLKKGIPVSLFSHNAHGKLIRTRMTQKLFREVYA